MYLCLLLLVLMLLVLPMTVPLQRDDLSAEQRSVLEVMQRTFATYITEKDEAVALKKKLNESEAALAGARNKMELGYTDPKTGAPVGEYTQSHAAQPRADTVKLNPGHMWRLSCCRKCCLEPQFNSWA